MHKVAINSSRAHEISAEVFAEHTKLKIRLTNICGGWLTHVGDSFEVSITLHPAFSPSIQFRPSSVASSFWPNAKPGLRVSVKLVFVSKNGGSSEEVDIARVSRACRRKEEGVG